MSIFDKITKKFTKKVVTNATDTVKEEAVKTLESSLPTILTLATTAIILISVLRPQKNIPAAASTIIINNYMGGHNGVR